MAGTTTNGRRTRTTTKKDFGDVIARESAKNGIDPKSKEVAKARKAKIKKDTVEASAEKAAQKLAAVNVEISKSLASIQNETQSAIADLNTVREAIVIAEEELEELHGKDVIASSTAELIAGYEDKNAELEAEFAEKKQKLQDEIFEQETQWTRTQEEKNRERKIADDTFNYDLGAKRRREDDVRKEQQKREEINYNLEQEARARNWESRETELSAKEGEFNSLKTEVEGFANKVKVEADAKVAIATNSLKKEMKHTAELTDMQRSTEISTLNSKVETLTNQNTEKNERILSLEAKLIAAEEKSQVLATKALEAQSGQAALAAATAMAEKTGQKK